MKKKLMLLLSLALCMFCLAGCKSQKDDSDTADVDSEIISTCVSTTEDNFTTWNETDFATQIDASQVDDSMLDEYNQWIALQKKLGSLKSQSETKTEVTDSTIVCTIKGKYEHGQTAFCATFDTAGTFQDVKVDEEFTMAQSMQKALLNTVMGMGVVFVVLIVMSIILSGFGKLMAGTGKKQEKEPETAVFSASAPAETQDAVDVTNDLELAAVITAAIMASLGKEAPAEGLVVRSIRRRNADKWKNA